MELCRKAKFLPGSHIWANHSAFSPKGHTKSLGATKESACKVPFMSHYELYSNALYSLRENLTRGHAVFCFEPWATISIKYINEHRKTIFGKIGDKSSKLEKYFPIWFHVNGLIPFLSDWTEAKVMLGILQVNTKFMLPTETSYRQ